MSHPRDPIPPSTPSTPSPPANSAPFRRPLGALLRQLKARGKTAFIPYLTAGDPDLAATASFISALARGGAAMIELGVPFSDPMADGPVIQRASERALRGGTTLRRILAMVRGLREAGQDIPLVLFTYANPVFAFGLSAFARAAAEAGIDAVLVLDLPPEEAGEHRAALAAAGLQSIFLAAPTSDAGRLALIDAASTGFVYFVSRTGVTGERGALAADLAEQMARVRATVRGPVAVGFGISDPEQAAAVARLADGVVIGSTLVRLVEESSDRQAAVERLVSFSRAIVAALDKEPGC
jgi:tryptophan synthase alpha chain